MICRASLTVRLTRPWKQAEEVVEVLCAGAEQEQDAGVLQELLKPVEVEAGARAGQADGVLGSSWYAVEEEMVQRLKTTNQSEVAVGHGEEVLPVVLEGLVPL